MSRKKEEFPGWAWMKPKERRILKANYEHFRHELRKKKNGVPIVVEPVEVDE